MLGSHCLLTGFIVVDERKDFDVSFFSPQKGHHAIVSGMYDPVFDHGKRMIHAVKALQMPVRREHVQPFRKEDINLGIIFLERDKAGCIPGDVIGGADTFIRIQHNL